MPKTKYNDVDGWKPLKLEGPLLSDGIDGLIGIEELTDYKLEKKNKKAKIVLCEGKAKAKDKPAPKRKHSNSWQEDNIIDTESSPKKVKFKTPEQEGSKKTQSKNLSIKKPLKNTSETTSDNESETDHIVNDNESYMQDINYHAWSSLGVPTAIIRALADQRFQCPTTIQALTLAPAILGRRDILGAAETGSGKTLAFGIPILNGILESKSNLSDGSAARELDKESYGTENKGWVCSEQDATDDANCSASESEPEEESGNTNVNGIGCVRVINNVQISAPQNTKMKPLYALILTPTRELAIQIKDHLTKAAKYTDIKIAVVLGGMAAVKQERLLSKCPEIVIATPGRLWELIQQGNPHLNQVDSIKYLAIDETDRMLERGHFQELQQLLEKINMNAENVKQRQTFVFSATLTMVHDIPDYLQRKKKNHVKSRIFKLTPGQKLQKIIHLVGIKNPKIVDVTKTSGTAANLTECRIACTIDHKDYYLYYFLKRHAGRTLVFCNSIGCVKRLATLFGILECKPLPLHASMQQRQRLKNLERFQADDDGLLIATDVAARGLDIPNVEHVIHYQVPRTSESYVHRSGRTARAQKEGITVLMMEPSEKQNYSKLCKTLGRTQDLPAFPVIDRLLIAVKERVDVAREIDKFELKCRRDNSQKGWLRKAVEEMDMVLDEDEEETTLETKEVADLKHQLKVKKRQLQSMLSKPLFPKGYSGKYPDINVTFELEQANQKAVDVMKKVIEEIPKKKKESSINTRKRRANLTKGKFKKSKK